jgi:hypothetical protein
VALNIGKTHTSLEYLHKPALQKDPGGITIDVQDQKGTVYRIVGRVEMMATKSVANRKY